MKMFTRTSAVLWISGLAVALQGCAMNRADSLRMLDRRAEYDSASGVGRLSLQESSSSGMPGPIPVRSQPKVAEVWIHAHEMASRDYFWGGWMSVVVEPDEWEIKRQAPTPSARGGRTPRRQRLVALHSAVPPTAEIAPEGSPKK